MMVETTATEDLVYPVPPVLSEHLLIPSSANSCANVSAVLKCLTVDLNRPVNLSKISAFAKHHFRQNSRKPSHFLYLTGSIISEEVGLHYLQARTGDLLAPYIHFVQNLGLFVPKINLPDKLIGSAHVLKKQAVTVILSEFYADLRSVEIRSINGFFAHHNWFVSYVSIVLMFATASRGERRQPIRFKDFNFNDGLLILREKGGSRIVPLPHSVMKQLRYYRRYLEHIKKRSRARDRDLFERLEQVLNPDTNAPFLFTISNEGGFECAFSDDLFIQNIFGLKRNFARHFGYTQLVKKLIEEDLKAMLGHVREFDGSTDLFSCQSFQQLDAVRASIDHLLRDLNIKVFDPFSVSLKPRRKAA
ncbi:hypothetical protein [Kordiimonas sp.]|uniref:hypothetical protein n=1 Tax=Kordiimonas sp. TaxID=1970157 RepID=UPI003B51ACA5